jgi:hypothetical protein
MAVASGNKEASAISLTFSFLDAPISDRPDTQGDPSNFSDESKVTDSKNNSENSLPSDTDIEFVLGKSCVRGANTDGPWMPVTATQFDSRVAVATGGDEPTQEPEAMRRCDGD